jgi:hypothetical protein
LQAAKALAEQAAPATFSVRWHDYETHESFVEEMRQLAETRGPIVTI